MTRISSHRTIYCISQKNFFVREPADIVFSHRPAHMRGSRFCKRKVTVSTDQFYLSNPSWSGNLGMCAVVWFQTGNAIPGL